MIHSLPKLHFQQTRILLRKPDIHGTPFGSPGGHGICRCFLQEGSTHAENLDETTDSWYVAT